MSATDTDNGLRHALEQVRELQVTRDALQSSVDSLKVLVSNERMQSRAAKRRLAAVEEVIPEEYHANNLVEAVQRMRRKLEDGGTGNWEVLLDDAKKERGVAEKAREDIEVELNELKKKLDQVDKEKDTLLQRGKQLQEDIEAGISKEEEMQRSLQDKENQIADLEGKLRENNAVTTAMKDSVDQVTTLKSRVLELENELKCSAGMNQLTEEEPKSDKDVATNSDTKNSSSKKLSQKLRIAKRVLAEKDKIISEMNERISESEKGKIQAEWARNIAEERVKSMEEALRSAQKEADAAKDKVSMEIESRERFESEATRVKGSLEEMNEKVSALTEEVGKYQAELEDLGNSKAALEEQLQLADEKLEMATEDSSKLEAKLEGLQRKFGEREIVEQQTTQSKHCLVEEGATEEVQNLQARLDAAETEVKRLETLLEKRINVVEDFGASSPCSTDPGAGAEERKNVLGLSYTESMERIVELEEIARLAKSSYEQKCKEAETFASSIAENTSTIVTLNRALQVSRESSDKKHEKLEVSMAKANSLQRTVRKLKDDLSSRLEECDFLENRIKAELEPSLLKTNTQLDQRIGELKATREEFKLHKEMSEKTRVALEKEVGNLSARLQEVTSSLNEVQSKLIDYEHKAVGFKNEIAALTHEKSENLELIEELTSHCEHRRESLSALEHRLLHIGQVVADYEQAAHDAHHEKDELKELLNRIHDKKEVAERRATRKDDIVEEMEGKLQELRNQHLSARSTIEDIRSRLKETEHCVQELKDVVRLKDQALHDQADAARDREALFEALATNLKQMIESRDKELELANEDICTIERRVKSLTEALKEENEQLCRTRDELAVSQRQNEHFQTENRVLETKLSDAQDKYSLLKEQYQAALDDITEKELLVRSQLDDISSKEGKILGLNAEKAELEKLILHVREALKGEEENRTKLEDQVESLEAFLADAHLAAEKYKNEIALNKSEIDSLTKALENAQENIGLLESALSSKEEELNDVRRTSCNFEDALARAKQQVSSLESHLGGHDVLLKDRREKEELLAVKSGELKQANQYIETVEESAKQLRDRQAATEAELERVAQKLKLLIDKNEALSSEVARAQNARTAAEKSLSCTSATLDALEAASTSEVEQLKNTIVSLRGKLTSDGNSGVSLDTSGESRGDAVTDERIIEIQAKNNRLTAKLSSTESELISKREILSSLESKLVTLQAALNQRDNHLEEMGKDLIAKNQALSLAKSRLEDVTVKSSNAARADVMKLQTKLDAKEKAIAHLHNWCCFINGKLHATEKALTEREIDLETSCAAFKKLETHLIELNDILAEKESKIIEVESLQVVEISELRSRIQSMQYRIEEANAERQKTEQFIESGSGSDASTLLANRELDELKEVVRSKQLELSKLQALYGSLEETTKQYETDLEASRTTIESLTDEISKMKSTSCSGTPDLDIIAKLERVEAELASAYTRVKQWQTKAKEQERIAESATESQKTIEMMASQLAQTENELQGKIDFLEIELEQARRALEFTPREKLASSERALAQDVSSARLRGTMSLPVTPVARDLCTVTFILDGALAPDSSVAVHILGEDIKLGEWDAARRIIIPVVGVGKNGVVRKRDVILPSELSTVYKFAADSRDGELVWEIGENRTLHLEGETSRIVHDTWRSTQ